MTVATSEPSTALALPAPSSVSATVARYADDLGHCLAFAARIVDTPIVPASFWPAVVIYHGDNGNTLKSWEWDVRTRHPKESPEQFAARRDVAVATTGGTILLGGDLELPWSAAIGGIYFVGGRPSLMAEQMRALVLSKGHHFRTVERTAERCIVEVKRLGTPGEPVRYEFTIEQAVRAGYVKGKGPNSNTKGGNDKYNSDPATMLYARATGIACKSEFPDVIRGMAVAEIADDEPVDITATTTVARVDAKAILGGNLTTGMVREAAASVALDRDQTHEVRETPAPEPASGPEPERAPDVPMCTDAQYRGINAWFKASGLREVNGEGQAAARTKVVNMLVADPQNGRPEVAKWSEMTAAEAQSVLDTLQANGFAIVAEALDWPAEQPSSEGPNHEQAAAQAEAEQTYQAEAEHDPTTEPGWGEQA